jgi:FAD/FMN-containing dehydrogenase
MIDKQPALIVRCAQESDVIESVKFARAHNLLVAVRGGGHSLPGHSVCDGGLMIDLSLLKRIQVDPERQTVRAEPGVTWGELDRETQVFGLAVTGGQISHTGIAGLTLGGGIGWLMRKYGLTCDNLLAVDLVTAEGRLLTASVEENADLFWALRGGGGNFGIATSFEYQLHPVGPVLGGLVAYPLPEAKTVLQALRRYSQTAPDELTVTVAFLTTPDGHQAVGIALCYAGDPQTGEKVIEPLRKLGTVVMEQIGPMPYPAVQSMLDHAAVPGRRYYLKSNFLDELSDEAIDVLTDQFTKVPSPLSIVIVVQMGGAVRRIERQATAFYHRDVAYSVSAFSTWIEAQDDDKNITWARQLWEALRPYAPSAVYVNELVDEGEDRIRAAYGPIYDRLVAVKNRYDPTNLFRLNQNIKPTV